MAQSAEQIMDDQNLVKLVHDRWREADAALLEERRHYWLNLAFYEGYQWVWWDKNRNRVDALADDPDRVRVTINRFKPRLNSLMGRLTKRNLGFEVPATAVDDTSIHGAQLAHQLLEVARVEDDWESAREENLFNVFMGGTAAILVDWDADKKSPLTIDRKIDKVAGGDIVLQPLSITEFALEPGTRRPADARWAIIAMSLPPDQIQDMYDLDERPSVDSAGGFSAIQRRIVSDRGVKSLTELTTLYFMYERPTNDQDGRVVVVASNKVIHVIDWPYPFDELPLQVFRQTKIPSRWTGDTLCTNARPVQAAYNHVRSNILEHAKLAGNARMMIPWGSLPDDYLMTDEPGEQIRYTPDGTGSKPEWMSPPQIARWLTSEADRLQDEMDDIMHTHAASRGQSTGSRDSGRAVALLTENDDTPLGIMGRDQSNGWGSIATRVLKMYETKVTKKRTASFTRNDVPITIKWDGKALHGQTRAIMPLESAMPHSRVAQQAALVDLKNAFPDAFNQIPAPVLLRMMEVDGLDKASRVMDDDVGKAQWENETMSQGGVCIPDPWHDHAVHIAEHNRARNEVWFEFADDDKVRGLFQEHIDAHDQFLRDEMANQQIANAAMPGLGALPQGNEPVGSLVPRDSIDGPLPPPGTMPAGPLPPS